MNERRAWYRGQSGWAAVFALIALGVGPACPAQSPAAPEKVATIEGITEYRLDNGLRVLLFPDPSTPNFTVNLTVFVGSRHEGYGETGMAHLLEHMLFKGTPTHRDIPRALKEHGATFNGSTWVDRTNYFETMSGTPANLEFGLRLEADRLVNSLVRREDLASEMTVVRNEFEMGENNPQYILRQRMMAVAYEWHNYGKTTIGNRSDIERVPIERLQAFYRKYYRPDNAMLVVAGRFDPNAALELIGRYFGALKRPSQPLDATYTEEPPQDGERRVVLRRVGKVAVVGAVYHICAGPHPDSAPLEVLGRVLSAEPAGRLYKALVETKKATDVQADANAYHDPGVFEVIAQVDKGSSPGEVQRVLLGLLEPREPARFTAEEVERAKRELLTQRELLMTQSNTIGRVLSEWGAMGDWRLFFLHRDRLQKVTPDDVARVARHYLMQSNRTLGVFEPTEHPVRAAVPETPPVEEIVKNYKGGRAVAAGEAFEPTPANIEKRTRRSEVAGGLKVALLPKKTRGEAVSAELVLHYGSAESLKGLVPATEMLGAMMERGTKRHTRQQLQDELNRLGARLSAFSMAAEPGAVTFSVEARRPNWPAVLRLLTEIVREPAFPGEEFEVLKRERRAGLERSLTEPLDRARTEMRRRLRPYPPEDVRYTPTLEEAVARLEAANVEQVRALYAEQLGAQAAEFAAVGDFDADETRRLLDEGLGGWKATTAYRRIERPANVRVPGARLVIITPDKANAFYFAGESLAMRDTDPDYPALEVANFLFGGGTLSSRLGNRVRQKEGLSYGVVSMFAASAKDNAGTFQMAAICNPVNVEKVDKAITEELDRLLKEGVAQAELAEAKKSYLQQRRVMRASDRALAGMLATALYEGRTFAYHADLEKKVAALTPDAVNAAVRKHIDPKRLIVIHAGDLRKKAAAPAAPAAGAGESR